MTLHLSVTKRFGAACLAGILWFSSAQGWAHEFKLGDLDIEHPWSRETPAGAKVAAGYLIIKNGSSTPDRLVSATAELAGTVEFHEMTMTDNVMSMRQIDGGVEIPANGEVRFEPNSYHLMFKELKAPAVKGKKFAGTLTFEKAGTVAVEFAVDAMGGDDHTSHGG